MANGSNSVALGADANASHINSTAIGANAQTTENNQVRLGAAGSSVSIGDIDASDAAQVGPEQVLTVDANGTIGLQSVSGSSLAAIRVSAVQSLAVSDAQFNALDGRVGVLEGQVNTLFDLSAVNRKRADRGIAAAVALTDAPFPSAPGKTSYAANGAVYRGEFAISASISHRLEVDSPFAITAGFSQAGGKNTAARVGIAGEF